MEFLYNIVVALHFLGLASLIGGALVQMKARGERQINRAIIHGALVQVLTGLILVGMQEMVDSLDRDPNHAKVGVKLLVALVIAVVALINEKRPTIPDGVYFTVFGLAVANVLVAVFW
ncbi:hypothetical protein EF847_18795 [Actinobacteria bacterium YIM 96077]|uniref:Integral membrane protein n=1 Tax=Phytoactinopolyspora halophila TaxID=1981511 RepID=A0A329QGK8_9ACTN|nr:hypothetical protein [Phytoactinopolyspora halophila]AYY14437.1 hypothetical protein EF847_18795 [Actinobacteria bacterium YIM 96077]RAW11430.1 hypothetical protein DPM12_16445 [Phytoactinopolyspora halophila]